MGDPKLESEVERPSRHGDHSLGFGREHDRDLDVHRTPSASSLAVLKTRRVRGHPDSHGRRGWEG